MARGRSARGRWQVWGLLAAHAGLVGALGLAIHEVRAGRQATDAERAARLRAEALALESDTRARAEKGGRASALADLPERQVEALVLGLEAVGAQPEKA